MNDDTREPNVVPLTPARSQNGGGNGGGIGERLARVEADMKHLATKADLQALKNDLLKWQIGILAIACISLIVAALLTKGG